MLCPLVEPDPSVAAAEEAVEAAQGAGCRSVLAVGGEARSSSARSWRSAFGTRAHRLLRGPGPCPRTPGALRGVPTTAGSGSEVSNALVLHDPGRDRHVVVRGPGLEPDVALLDGELLRSLPRAPFLDAAIDALSHALEALLAHGASRFTDALALSAARDIRLTLPRAVEDRQPDDLQAMLEASAMANLACGNSHLGLVHALSSSASVHVSHGRQNTVLLPHVASFNEPVLDEAARREIAALADLYSELGIEPTWHSGELDAAAGESMVQAALANPFRINNLRLAGELELREILAELARRGSCPRMPRSDPLNSRELSELRSARLHLPVASSREPGSSRVCSVM